MCNVIQPIPYLLYRGIGDGVFNFICTFIRADSNVKRVEVVFDDRRHATGNKSFLQAKQAEAVGGAARGIADEIDRTAPVPHRGDLWSQWLASAKRKRQLLNVMSKLMPKLVGPHLEMGQEFLVAGGFDGGEYDNKACVVSREGDAVIKKGADKYCSNQAEADTRIWLHVLLCPCDMVIVFSPDSDVLMVGLLTFRKWKTATGGGQEREHGFVQISWTRGEERNRAGHSGREPVGT
jgi:hypothetical protein